MEEEIKVEVETTDSNIEEVKEQKEIKEVKKTVKRTKYKIEKCKVISASKDTFVIDFHGHGIEFKGKSTVDKLVEVSYTGEIGKQGFVIKLK